jgi:hypothetical protein
MVVLILVFKVPNEILRLTPEMAESQFSQTLLRQQFVQRGLSESIPTIAVDK